jgi:hypothetical protein
MASKKCVICEKEFETPGIRCLKCRDASTGSAHRRGNLGLDPILTGMEIPMLLLGLNRRKPPASAPLKERVDYLADEFIEQMRKK